MKRSPVVRIAGWCAALALAAPVFAQDIYKWLDAQGVVHYSDAPPPGASPAKIETVGPKLSSVPANPVRAAAGDGASRLEDRIAELERELAQARGGRIEQAHVDDEALLRWKQQCERDRRVDCEEAALAPYPPPGWISRPLRPYAVAVQRPMQGIGPGPGRDIGATYTAPPATRPPVLAHPVRHSSSGPRSLGKVAARLR